MGRKKVTGMGGMSKDCPYCNGVGWIEGNVVKITPKKRRKPAKPVLHVQEPAPTGE